ncbi:MAG TPA: hypothetical protein VIL86_14185 [Tepidisphaeraceae bacterium]
MTAYVRFTLWPLSIFLVVILLMSTQPLLRADDIGNKPSTQPATTKPAEERNHERLIAIRAATVAAYEYAKAHEQAIPTTEQLAKQMGVETKDFQYRVVPSGSLDKHMKRVKGDWPEVLIAEKQGGEDGKWAFGFVDGMCSIQSVESYREMENSAALQAIPEASTKPIAAP